MAKAVQKDYRNQMNNFTKSLKLREPAKHPLTLQLNIEANLASCPEASSGVATFTYADCSCEVTVGGGKDEKEIGRVCGGLGGTVWLSDNATHYRYVITPDVLWAAFQKALTEQKL